MLDYLKGSIAKFKPNFENALEKKWNQYYDDKISSKTLVCLEWCKL